MEKAGLSADTRSIITATPPVLDAWAAAYGSLADFYFAVEAGLKDVA